MADLNDEALETQVRAKREKALQEVQKRAASYFAEMSQALTEAVNAGAVLHR